MQIYQQLRGAFTMSPEQKLRVEAAIRQRASVQNAASAEPAAITETKTSGIRKQPGGGWIAARVLPLAACVMLAVGVGFFLHRTMKPPVDPKRQQNPQRQLQVRQLQSSPQRQHRRQRPQHPKRKRPPQREPKRRMQDRRQPFLPH